MNNELSKKILENEIKMLVSGMEKFGSVKACKAKNIWAEAFKIVMLKSSLEN